MEKAFITLIENAAYDLEIQIEFTRETSAEISFYSPAGQDFSFDINFNGTAEGFLEALEDYRNGYDVDEEAMKWVDPSTGHGRNGAPYHIKDIVEDCEAILNKIDTFCNDCSVAIEKFTGETED